jgi:hypothetical protein
MVANTMGTFTSVTVHCAQCHNHKFDPISQEDYYSLQAVFSALDRADKKYFLDPAMTERFNRLDGRRREISERKRVIESDAARNAGDAAVKIDAHMAEASKNPGGGIKGGVSCGESDQWGYKPLDRKNPTEVYDVHATLLHLLGIDHEKLSFHLNPRKNTPSIARAWMEMTRIVSGSPTINSRYSRHGSLKLKFVGSGRKSAG